MEAMEEEERFGLWRGVRRNSPVAKESEKYPRDQFQSESGHLTKLSAARRRELCRRLGAPASLDPRRLRRVAANVSASPSKSYHTSMLRAKRWSGVALGDHNEV